MRPLATRLISALSCVLWILAPARIVAGSGPGVLRVGSSADYPPFSFRDSAGEVTGFDIVVGRRLAADLGLQAQFLPMRWADLVGDLQSNRFDVAMSGVTIRSDRALQLAFTRPYATTGAVAVVRADGKQKPRTLTRLDHAGVRIGVNAGGHLEQVARQHFPHASVRTVADNRALPDLLRRGVVDAVISEEFEAHTWSGQEFVSLGPFTRDRKAYAVAPTARDLLQQIDDWLAAREADGWLNEQRRRWLGERALLTPMQAGCEALVAAIDLRLQLMPLVAAVKRREHLQIDDPAQEARVLERVRTAAAAQGLMADDVTEVFRVQIAAAKDVERSAPPVEVPVELSLAQLRPAVGRASDTLVAELARSQPWLHEANAPHELEKALASGLTAPAVPAALRREISQSLLRVRHGQ